MQDNDMTELLLSSQEHGLSLSDIEPFLCKSFDPQEYANAIIDAHGNTHSALNGGSSSGLPLHTSTALTSSSEGSAEKATWVPHSGRVEGDLSVALGKLNVAIDDVDKVIRDEVTNNAAALLNHTTNLSELKSPLSDLTASLTILEMHQQKVVSRVTIPRQNLQKSMIRLTQIRSTSSLVNRCQKLVRLFRRLSSQMRSLGEKKPGDKNRLEQLGEEDGEGEEAEAVAEEDLPEALEGQDAGPALTRAASTLREIASLLDEENQKLETKQLEEEDKHRMDIDQVGSLMQLDFVKEYIPIVNESKEKITDLMEESVVRGLRDLSPTLLSTSLQTAFNLGQLTDLVRDLLSDLTEVIKDRVRAALDMQTLAQEMGSREPMAIQPAAYKARRGEQLTGHHQKWTAALWHRLEILVGELGAVCSKVYTLERVLSFKHDPATNSSYLDLSLCVLKDRPSVTFWSTIGEALDEQFRRANSPFLIQTLELGYPRLVRLLQDLFAKVSAYTGTIYTYGSQSPETLLVLRSFARFEKSYLEKANKRLESMFSSSWSQRHNPSKKDAEAIISASLDELDVARIDPLLIRAVSQIVLDWLSRGIQRINELIVQDALLHPTQDVGPGHRQNATITSAAYALLQGLKTIVDQGPTQVRDRTLDLTSELQSIYEEKLVSPLVTTIRKELSDILSRMHYVDFGLDREAIGSNGSAYMQELSDRTWVIREQLLVHYDVPTAHWLVQISKHALHDFVLHASLLRPLEEGGKLRLTTDMTELEFSVSQLLASARHSDHALTMTDCGSDFRALRSFRHLLFSDVLKFSFEEQLKAGLPASVACHHVIGRSKTIPFPFETQKWSCVEYIRWLDSHTLPDLVQIMGDSLLALSKQLNSEQSPDEALLECLEHILVICQRLDGANEPNESL